MCRESESSEANDEEPVEEVEVNPQKEEEEDKEEENPQEEEEKVEPPFR